MYTGSPDLPDSCVGVSVPDVLGEVCAMRGGRHQFLVDRCGDTCVLVDRIVLELNLQSSGSGIIPHRLEVSGGNRVPHHK